MKTTPMTTTVAPVQEASSTTKIDPEFIRPKRVSEIFGIPRGTLYDLIASNQIEAKQKRVKGKTRGICLVSVQSIRAWINSPETDVKPSNN